MSFLAYIDIFGIYLIPVLIIAALNYKKANPTYKPVLWYIYLLGFNQLIEIVLILIYYNNLPAYNIGGLLNFLLFIYILSTWKYIDIHKSIVITIIVIAVILFISEATYNGSLFKETNYSKAIYSFLTILFALNAINKTLFKEPNLGIFNTKTLFCLALIVESSFWIYLAIFLNPRFNFSNEFIEAIYIIYRYCKIYIITSIYIFACLKIPKSNSNFLTYNKQ